MADSGPLAASVKAALALRVVRAYVRVRRHTRGQALPRTLERLRSPARSVGPAGRHQPERLARATRRTLGILPGDTRCLMQSLTLTTLLSEQGIASKLVIGVQAGERFGAHAWVELDGRPLLPPGGEDFPRLVEL